MDGIFVDGTSRARFAKQINVHGDEGKNSGRYNQNMRHKEARERERAHIGAAAHQALNPAANERNFAGNVGSYGGGEISFLIPRQKVARECHAKHETKEAAAA